MNQKYKHEYNIINDYIKEFAKPNLKKNLLTKVGILDAIGLSMKDIRQLGKSIGTNHGLAVELFDSSIFEYLMLASIIADSKELNIEIAKKWLKKAQSTMVVDQGLSPLLMHHPKRHQWLNMFLFDQDLHIRYGGYSLLSSYLRGEPLETLDNELGKKALETIRDSIINEPITIQNAMNNAVVMAGLHVPFLVEIATEVAAHIGYIVPLVARNQCNIQSASDYLLRYSNQPKYSRVAMLQKNKQ